METWWPVDQGFWWGAVGGGLGALLGVGGAIVGGYLVPHDRGHRGVLIGMVAVGFGALLCAVAGVVAIADGQPYRGLLPATVGSGCVVYWVIVGLIPQIDMAYRSVQRDDWRPRGRYGKWVNPLITAHVAVGFDRPPLGRLADFGRGGIRGMLPGSDGRGRVPGFRAGQLWLIKSMAIRGFSRGPGATGAWPRRNSGVAETRLRTASPW